LLLAGARDVISFEFYGLLVLFQGNEQEILCVKYLATNIFFMTMKRHEEFRIPIYYSYSSITILTASYSQYKRYRFYCTYVKCVKSTWA
jgi:hypothetical protein